MHYKKRESVDAMHFPRFDRIRRGQNWSMHLVMSLGKFLTWIKAWCFVVNYVLPPVIRTYEYGTMVEHALAWRWLKA